MKGEVALGLLALGLALGMYISYFLCRFHLRLVVNANPVSSGIWAYEFLFWSCVGLENTKGFALGTLPVLVFTDMMIKF